MKVLSRSFKFFFIAVALVLLAVLAFVATFDANNYKPEIIEQVENATGRDFRIDGDINLSIFPWIGLKVENVSLGNAKGFKAAQFAAIKQLDVKVNVLPLLKKEVQINTIRLHGLDVSLEVASDKSNNWADLSQSDKAEDGSDTEYDKKQDDTAAAVSKSDAVSKENNEAAASPLESLKVEGFEFVDATIRYSDLSANTQATVTSLNLTTSAITFDEAIDIAFSAHIKNNQPEIDTQLKLTTQLIFNKELTQFNLRDFVFTILAQANEFIAQEEQVEIKSDIDVSMDEQRVLIKQLEISALGVVTQAEITVSQFLETPLIQGGIEVLPFNARSVAKRAGVELPAMAKAEALNKVGIKTKIKMQGDSLQANDFSFMLDDSTMTGWIHLPSISKQSVRYDLAFDQLNINDYMPPEATPVEVSETESKKDAAKLDVETGAAASVESTATTTTGDEKIELPVEMMRTLDIQGDFRVGALTAKEYEIKQLLMSLQAQQGVIAIKPLSMQLLEGQLDMSANLNVQKEIPTYAIKLDVNQMQIGPVANPILDGMLGEKPMKIDGAVNLAMDIKTAGDSVNQLKQASKGPVVFDMKETRIDGFDPEYYMRKAVADYAHSIGFGLSKTVMGKFTPREVTVFDKIHSTVNVADGKARTNDFLMDSKRVQIRAEGYVDIMKNKLDVTSSTQLPRAKTTVEKIFDSPVFVRVYGPFDALEYELNKDKLKESTSDVYKKEAKAKVDAEKQRLKAKAAAEKQRLKAKADEEKKKAEKKAKKKLKKKTDKYKDKLKDKLKGLF